MRLVQRKILLVTERLQVTTWRPEDLEDLCRLHSDPVTMRWVRHGRPETRDEVEALLACYLDEQQIRGWTKWRVADRESKLVGRAGFSLHVDGRGRELG
jgi:RimJ/RimL family protein N-acetyltransferase